MGVARLLHFPKMESAGEVGQGRVKQEQRLISLQEDLTPMIL